MKTYVITYNTEDAGLAAIFGATTDLDKAKEICLNNRDRLDNTDWYQIDEYDGTKRTEIGCYNPQYSFTASNYQFGF